MATAAANRARIVADEARRIASEAGATRNHDADALASTGATDDEAREAYHHAEDEARRRSAKST